MENKNKSVYERLDSIEEQNFQNTAQNQEIINAINNLTKIVEQQKTLINDSNKNDELSKQIVSDFFKKSRKEHLWVGNEEEFKKLKNLFYLTTIPLFFICILSAVLSSISVGMFNPLIILQIVWISIVFDMIIKVFSLKRRMTDYDLQKHSCTMFFRDNNGTLRDSLLEMKLYKIPRILSCFASVVTIILVLSVNPGIEVAFVIPLEIISISLSIASYFARNKVTEMYNYIILFTGQKYGSNENVTIVYIPNENKYITYEEFSVRYKKLFE